MIVRQFTKHDARDVCNVVAACINAETSLDRQSRFYLLSNNVAADFYNEVKDDYVLVGELHGQIIAVGALGDDKIHHINVSPDYRGQGIGETLMVALEAEAQARGVEVVKIESPAPSIEFYREMGYDILKTMHTKIGFTTIEVVRMQKYLSKLAGV